MREEREWVEESETGREGERRTERVGKTFRWWWWDLFRPGSFYASVTGAPEPGTGSLVKHATTHLLRHHSLPLFPPAPLAHPLRLSPSLFFAQPCFSISFPLLLSSLFSLLSLEKSPRRRRSKRAIVSLVPSTCSPITTAIEIHPCISSSSSLRGVSLGTLFGLFILRYFRRKGNFFGTKWRFDD